ncbi:MAG: recombinase family protein [Lachnospiraceae bacterium]|nr:recombinase family protein [Lachnospiraceae bacterium]
MAKEKVIEKNIEDVAVIYARFSPGPRQTEQSIEGQVRDCREYAEKSGLKIVDIYADHHISGSDFEGRVEFNRLIRDAEKGQFKYIIVWKIDRFGRDREEIALNKVRIKKHGVKLLYAKENIPDGPEGIILEGLLESLAEYYVADLRQKVKRGQRESAIKGHAFGQCPLGYIKKDKKWVVNESEAAIVRQVFLDWDAGLTAVEIIDKFEKQGIRSRKGQHITKNGIYTILRNSKYIGVCYYDDILIPIPAIVDITLWDSCHSKFQKRIGQAASYKAEEKYLLSLKCFCGQCSSLMVGESGRGKGGTVYHYYKCATNKRKAKERCITKTVRKEWLEDLVLEHTMKDVLQDDIIDHLATCVMEIQEKNTVNYTLQNLKQAFTTVQTSIKNIMKAIEAGIITDTTKSRLMELEAQSEELRMHIAREELKKPALTKEHVVFWLESFRSGDLCDDKFREKLCDIFIHSVYVYNQKVVIAYNYANNNHSLNFTDVLRCSDEHLLVRHRGFEPRTT